MSGDVAAGLKPGLEAVVRTRTRSKVTLPLLDINVGGCLVEARGWSAKPDETISIKLPGLGFIAAKVVWIEDKRAGLAFDEVLYGPTVEQMQA